MEVNSPNVPYEAFNEVSVFTILIKKTIISIQPFIMAFRPSRLNKFRKDLNVYMYTGKCVNV